jgi:uncharacterized protein
MRLAVLTLAAGWVLLVVVTWALQERLIYLPDTTRPAPPADVTPIALQTRDGLHLEAWHLPHPDPVATVVVAPGNAGNRAHRILLARGLQARGHAVLLVDYRGYGGNPGRPSEQGVTADVDAAVAWVRSREPDRSGMLVLLGESIGSSVAASVAAELDEPPAALVLRSPFPRLADVGRRHYPFLPVRTLLREHHATSAHLAQVDAPVLVVAGDADRIVPTELSRQVADDAGAELVVVEGAGHNDHALLDGPRYLDAVDAFVRAQAEGR